MLSAAPLKDRVQRSRQCVLGCRQQVAVGVEGHLEVSVAQMLLSCLRMRACGYEQRGAGTPEIVESKPKVSRSVGLYGQRA